MVVVTGNWRIALAGLAASLLIFGVLFFAVIQPSQNTANQAVKTGLQQSQQALDQAQKQLSSATTPALPATPASPAAATSSATSQTQQAIAGATSKAQQTLNKATKLANCLSAAGIDASKVAACQANFGH
jgi:flavin-binding protein dodecin